MSSGEPARPDHRLCDRLTCKFPDAHCGGDFEPWPCRVELLRQVDTLERRAERVEGAACELLDIMNGKLTVPQGAYVKALDALAAALGGGDG